MNGWSRFKEMKSKFLLVLATAAGSTVCSAQNLVPNGSFEEVINCPEVLGALHTDCADWFSSVIVPGLPQNENPSSDWFHPCSPQALLAPPETILGFVEPFDGVALAGFLTSWESDANYKEPIGVQLESPMTTGSTYVLRFSLFHTNAQNNEYSSNNVGVRFTTYSGYESLDAAITNEAHLNIDSVLAWKDFWQTFEFEFTADSAYEYMHIGNFFDDDNTIIAGPPEISSVGSYYFIDNVVLQLESPVSINDNSSKQSGVSLFPNPVQDYFTIGSPEGITKYILYNLSGDQIRSEEVSNSSSLKSDISFLPSGIYILQVTTQTNSYYERVVKI
jgi:hypothetical protein